ncbi:MAG: transcriptional repressor [Bacteroidales bacterium]|nr:transcriptional repressor [Bacteroidales bacterium]
MDALSMSNRLETKGIRPSVQRLEIYEYLLQHRTHPTVDEIFEALHSKIPTLSKTTIYNTLSLFVEKGLAMIVSIDEKNQRYDACTEPHTHFRCHCCGRVFDFPFPRALNVELPANFVVKQSDVFLHGICENCH